MYVFWLFLTKKHEILAPMAKKTAPLLPATDKLLSESGERLKLAGTDDLGRQLQDARLIRSVSVHRHHGTGTETVSNPSPSVPAQDNAASTQTNGARAKGGKPPAASAGKPVEGEIRKSVDIASTDSLASLLRKPKRKGNAPS